MGEGGDVDHLHRPVGIDPGRVGKDGDAGRSSPGQFLAQRNQAVAQLLAVFRQPPIIEIEVMQHGPVIAGKACGMGVAVLLTPPSGRCSQATGQPKEPWSIFPKSATFPSSPISTMASPPWRTG